MALVEREAAAGAWGGTGVPQDVLRRHIFHNDGAWADEVAEEAGRHMLALDSSNCFETSMPCLREGQITKFHAPNNNILSSTSHEKALLKLMRRREDENIAPFEYKFLLHWSIFFSLHTESMQLQTRICLQMFPNRVWFAPRMAPSSHLSEKAPRRLATSAFAQKGRITSPSDGISLSLFFSLCLSGWAGHRFETVRPGHTQRVWKVMSSQFFIHSCLCL